MIVVNGRFLGPRPTGIQRTARSLVDAIVGAGLEVEVVAPPGVRDARVDRHVWAPPGRVGDHLWEQVCLPLVARPHRVLSLANTAPLAAARSVTMVHDLAPLAGPGWFARPMRAYAGLALAAARRADAVLTVSHVIRDDLVRHRVQPDRIVVVPPAVDPIFRPADDRTVAKVRGRLGLADDPYLLFVGWADPRKDLGTAVAAHRRVRRDIAHRLVLVGRPHRNFRAVDAPPDVVLAGSVTDGDLVALLTGAAALLYPSRYEGFGLPPLEAWSCGTPAIVSDLAVLRESTRGRATYAPVADVAAWATCARSALAGELGVPQPPAWTWADAARHVTDLIQRLG